MAHAELSSVRFPSKSHLAHYLLDEFHRHCSTHEERLRAAFLAAGAADYLWEKYDDADWS